MQYAYIRVGCLHHTLWGVALPRTLREYGMLRALGVPFLKKITSLSRNTHAGYNVHGMKYYIIHQSFCYCCGIKFNYWCRVYFDGLKFSVFLNVILEFHAFEIKNKLLDWIAWKLINISYKWNLVWSNLSTLENATTLRKFSHLTHLKQIVLPYYSSVDDAISQTSRRGESPSLHSLKRG